MAPQRGFARQLEVRRQPAQAVHLVAHLAGRGLGRPSQSGVQRAHPVHHCRQLRIESRARGCQLPLALHRHRPGGQQLRQGCRRFAEYPFQRQLVPVQQFADGRLNQRCGKPRQRRRHSAQNALVEHSGLGKVSHLSRPADNFRRRQKKILKHGPQQRRGRNALRLGLENAHQIGS